MSKQAVLLLNLGSPDSTSIPDVKRYLREFLGDERVIDRPPQPGRWLLVNGIIVPFRAKKSAHAYEQVWTDAGSPLVVTSQHAQAKLQARVDLPIELAMNYAHPSIAEALTRLVAQGVDRLLLGHVDERAGVDDEHVGQLGFRGEGHAGFGEVTHHDFGVDEVLRAAKGDETDGGGHGKMLKR